MKSHIVKMKIGDEQEMSLKIDLFNEEEEVDVDDLLQIDYTNLLADLATFPVILNRFGLLLAEMENKVSEAELDLRIWQATAKKNIRNSWDAQQFKYNKDEVEEEMRTDVKYKVKRKQLNTVTKQRDIINSVYWAAKGKADNLGKLSLTVQAGDIDVDKIVGVFNGVRLRTFENFIK